MLLFNNNTTVTKKKEIDFETRLAESKRILEKYPTKVPCIIRISDELKVTLPFKNKYLVPGDMNIGQLLYSIRKKIILSSEHAIFMFLESGTIPPNTMLISQVKNEHVNDDGFLYFIIKTENVFGWK